jgi:hypothetical protein
MYALRIAGNSDNRDSMQYNIMTKGNQNEERRKKPKPEEHEGMPQHRHSPPAKLCEDRNPKYYEEHRNSMSNANCHTRKLLMNVA